MNYCAFCDNLAEYIVETTSTPICEGCKEVYEAGQASPDANIASIE